jgi:hydrogenase nickel incorporation protein HypA/HybF
MHEEAMLTDLVHKAEEVARREGAKRVTRVRLWVGARSHLAGPELKDHWAYAVSGTVLAGARVEIETSSDPNDPNAETVMLRSLDVDSVKGRS